MPNTVTDRQFCEMIAYYYALITHIDAEVGRLIDVLEEQNMRDNTIVVFMSDHGELLGDHGCTEKCLMLRGLGQSSLPAFVAAHSTGGIARDDPACRC